MGLFRPPDGSCFRLQLLSCLILRLRTGFRLPQWSIFASKRCRNQMQPHQENSQPVWTPSPCQGRPATPFDSSIILHFTPDKGFLGHRLLKPSRWLLLLLKISLGGAGGGSNPRPALFHVNFWAFRPYHYLFCNHPKDAAKEAIVPQWCFLSIKMRCVSFFGIDSGA